MLNKYFTKKMSYNSYKDNVVYLSNRLTGDYITIPKECYEVLEYTYTSNLTVGKGIDFFERNEDVEYYKDVLRLVDNICLLQKNGNLELNPAYISKITLSITNKCNLNCDYCCQDSCIRNNDEAPLDEIKKYIDNILKLKPMRVVLTGGEPMIRKDFFEILNYLHQNFDGKIQLMTNATFICKENVDNIIDKVYSIDISLDGYNEESCSKIRGPGVFSKIMNNINLLKEKNFHNLSASMVFGYSNENDIEPFKEFCNKNNIIPVVRGFMRLGRGKQNDKYLNHEMEMFYYSTKFNSDDDEVNAIACNPGSSQLYVHHNGNIYPCPNLQKECFFMGHINDLSSKQINNILQRRLPVFDIIESLKTVNLDKCKDCTYKLFCGYCVSNVMNMLESDEIFSYNCEKLKTLIFN
jgi:radical SAM protein with 4Fe4S-binding SPASM domain